MYLSRSSRSGSWGIGDGCPPDSLPATICVPTVVSLTCGGMADSLAEAVTLVISRGSRSIPREASRLLVFTCYPVADVRRTVTKRDTSDFARPQELDDVSVHEDQIC